MSVRVKIDSLSLEELRFRLRGELYEPGAAEYEDTCTLFNSMAVWRPALVARCTAAEDVVAALTFAREHGLEVAVRAGGHSVTGHSLCEGGLAIDLRAMRDVDVNLRDEVVRIGGGATWADVDRATRPYGLACGNLLAAQLVTPEGEIVCEALGEGPGLVWALLGWGDKFGVVTSLELQLHLQGVEPSRGSR